MCERIAGELLIGFHKNDQAADRVLNDIVNQQIPHVQVIEDLPHRLARAGLEIRHGLELLFYRLRVPPAEEEWKINYLQFFYKHAVLAQLLRNQSRFY